MKRNYFLMLFAIFCLDNFCDAGSQRDPVRFMQRIPGYTVVPQGKGAIQERDEGRGISDQIREFSKGGKSDVGISLMEIVEIPSKPKTPPIESQPAKVEGQNKQDQAEATVPVRPQPKVVQPEKDTDKKEEVSHKLSEEIDRRQAVERKFQEGVQLLPQSVSRVIPAVKVPETDSDKEAVAVNKPLVASKVGVIKRLGQIGGVAVGSFLVAELIGEIIGEIGQEMGDFSAKAKETAQAWKKSFQEGQTDFPEQNLSGDDEDNEKTDAKIVLVLSDVEKKFKQVLEDSKYSDKILKILIGKIKIDKSEQEIFIEYDFEKEGAGDIGLPFTPFSVTLVPQSVMGYVISSQTLLNKIAEGDVKDLVTSLLQPSSSLVFMIKFIQLVNNTLQGSVKTYSDKIDYITDEVIKLFYRLNLSDEDVNVSDLLKDSPKIIRSFFNENKIKVYSHFVKRLDEVDDKRTNLIDLLNEFGFIDDFKTKLEFIENHIFFEIQPYVSLTDKELFIYLIEFVAAGMIDDLSNEATKSVDIKTRCELFGVFIDKVKEKIQEAEFNSDQIQKVSVIEKCILNLKSNQNVFNFKKPEFGEFKLEYKENSWANSLEVFYNIYQKVNSKKLDVDYEYFDIGILNYGKRYTKFYLQAIFYRSLNYLIKAEKELSQIEGSVNFKDFDEKDFVTNPSVAFKNLIQQPMKDVDTAKEVMKSAIKNMNAGIKSADVSYLKVLEQVKKSVNSVLVAKMKFRRKYVPFYPITMSDGSIKTVTEFIKSNVAILKKHSKYVDKLIFDIYKPFDNHFGFTGKQLSSIH